MAGFRIEGDISGNVAEVDSNKNARGVEPGFTSGGVPRGGGNVGTGAIANLSERDSGTITGVREVVAMEADKFKRQVSANDNLWDFEIFNYTSQNTGKHTYSATTLAATITAAGITTNSGSVNTTNTGLTYGTHTFFPLGGTKTTICRTQLSFSAQPSANMVADFGLFLRGAANTYDPTDGVYFRMGATGMLGVVNNGTVETTVGPFPLALGSGTWAYTNNRVYNFEIQVNTVSASFFIDGVKYGEIATPVGQAFVCKSQALPWSFRHGHVGGAAGAITQMVVGAYSVYIRGEEISDDANVIAQRTLGSYQGLSGNTMGQLVAGTVTTGTLVKPTAAVPLNASLAANLPNSLGGRIFEALTAGLAVNVDGIYAQYQVPAGTALVQGRRLKILGLKLSARVQTVVAGGTAMGTEWYIVFGNTATSMQTLETASMVSGTTKAPRRVMCPELTQHMTATQAVDTAIAQNSYYADFSDAPIYVNPGEFISLVGNKIGTTVPTSGVIAHTYQFVYSWE